MHLSDVIDALTAAFPDLIRPLPEFRGERTVVLSDRARIADLSRMLRDELKFDFLVDICSVDHMGEEPRFEVVYEFYSYRDEHHLRVKCRVSEDELALPSVAGIYPTADWHEREIFDMMGIKFDGHPDLRRILMWDGYPHFPLRKDFPLEGLPTDVPGIAFTRPAPLEGGPFVAPTDRQLASEREPRSRAPQPK